MSDVITRAISEADAAGKFISSDELYRLLSYAGVGRVEITACVSKNVSTIVANTARALFLEQPHLIAPGGNAYTNRRMTTCLRDLEIILRYVTYALIAGDVNVLDDRCLNALRETYLVLGVPLDSMALAIGIMKLSTIKVISCKIALENINSSVTELSAYFDHATFSLSPSVDNIAASQAFKKFEDLEGGVTNNSAGTNSDNWEPDTYIKWLNQDKLVQKLQQYGEVEDPVLFEESAIDFFESWKQMPPNVKRQIWREREVMATLYEQMMLDWRNIKGFYSIAVAERIIGNKSQLAGILVFDSPVSEEHYRFFNLPTHIQVQSSIKPLEKEEEIVPLILEWMATPVPCSGEIVDFETVIETLPLLTTPLMQSGDSIAGCNQTGRVSFERAVTLTTFVIPRDSTTLADIRLLTVHHGFQSGYTNVHFCQKDSSVKVGELVYASPVQEKLAQRLDVSLIKPIAPVQINPLLKWASAVPKPPVILARGMLVQMYGGASGYQKGYIDYSGIMNFGPVSSAIPNFTALISSQPGDSGSLLVIGNDAGVPFANSAMEGYSEEFLEAVKFAMAGMLIEGSTAGTYPNMTIFRPISTIFQYLKVKAAYPGGELLLSTEPLQSHAENNECSSPD